jgi:hypothetical protein
VRARALVTGVQPEIDGMVGNAFWDRAGEPQKLGAARDLPAETLFTVAARGTAARRSFSACSARRACKRRRRPYGIPMPNECDVPLIVVQGEASQTAPAREDITLADVGRTMAACLALRETRRLDGAPVPAANRGRVLAGLCGGECVNAIVMSS